MDWTYLTLKMSGKFTLHFQEACTSALEAAAVGMALHCSEVFACFWVFAAPPVTSHIPHLGKSVTLKCRVSLHYICRSMSFA